MEGIFRPSDGIDPPPLHRPSLSRVTTAIDTAVCRNRRDEGSRPVTFNNSLDSRHASR